MLIITRPVSMLDKQKLAAGRNFFTLLLLITKILNNKHQNKTHPIRVLVSDRGEGWGCKGRRGEVREGRNPGESLERTRGRGKSDVRSSSTPLHKDNKIITSELSPFTQPKPPS